MEILKRLRKKKEPKNPNLGDVRKEYSEAAELVARELIEGDYPRVEAQIAVDGLVHKGWAFPESDAIGTDKCIFVTEDFIAHSDGKKVVLITPRQPRE